MLRTGRARHAPPDARVIGAVEQAPGFGVERAHLRPADHAAGPAGRQHQRAGRRADLQRSVVHERAADAAGPVVVGAELEADRLAAVPADIHGGLPPGGRVDALRQQPVDAAIGQDRDHVEEVRREGRRGSQFRLGARQRARVRRPVRRRRGDGIAVDVVSPEAQPGGGQCGRERHGLFDGRVACHVCAARRDAGAHAARAAVRRRGHVGRQHRVRADDPAGAGFETAVGQALVARGWCDGGGSTVGVEVGSRRRGRGRCSWRLS